MRTSDWIMRFLIFLLIGFFLYYLLFWAYPQYKSIDRQQPSRPSVSETLNQLDNGKEATLDAEDYEDEEEGKAFSTLKKGAGTAGALVAAGAATAKDAITRGAEKVGDGVGAAKDALSSTGNAIKERTDEAIAGTPSIDDLVTLKEEQAKEFEEQEGGSQVRDNSSVDSYGSTSNGVFMVVAGTYRQMINAENELKKLQKLGYNNASIAKFNKSTYASLIVDRFDNSAAAYKYKKELLAKGMDVYVHKKR